MVIKIAAVFPDVIPLLQYINQPPVPNKQIIIKKYMNYKMGSGFLTFKRDLGFTNMKDRKSKINPIMLYYIIMQLRQIYSNKDIHQLL